ncbi:TPA: flap endonuclease-1 [Candidatus Micrarchaeota archaeon]|nr:flap endonuclease-1 [Candidatus Micrarchaeota archaeon]
MGVELKDILVRHERSFEELEGKIAVDAYNTLYQFLSIIRQPDGTPLMDGKGRITSHISGLFYRTCNLLEKNIIPVYVFDGQPSELKKRTIAERAAAKAEAEELRKKALDEGDTARAGVLAQRTSRLTKEMAEEAKSLLTLMGLPWVQAPSEGEAQCAFMAIEGIVRAAASQDYDALLFGAPLLVRNMTISGRRKLPRREQYIDVVPEEILLQENLEALGINREKLVWIGILTGTDFNEGIYGIGPKKSLKLVKEHKTFEGILTTIQKEMDWKPVEEIFLSPPSKKVLKEELKVGQPDCEKITEFMRERDFSIERVENSIAKAFNQPVDSKQGQLAKWF